MIDDPLALVIYGITALAAGMYPVGFLFGACSSCCDECPEECTKCTHAYNGCQPVHTLLRYEIEGYDTTIDIVDPGGELSGGCGTPGAWTLTEEQYLEVEPESISGCILPSELTPAGPGNVDECDCPLCCNEVLWQCVFTFENDGFVRFLTTVILCFDGCDQTQAVGTIGEWILDDEQGPSENILAWLNSLAITVTLAIEPCDCGACCETEDGIATCDDDVAEGFCVDNSSGTIQRQWQGVGVGCDPDPCV